jgi:hypothetical protein
MREIIYSPFHARRILKDSKIDDVVEYWSETTGEKVTYEVIDSRLILRIGRNDNIVRI